MSVYKGIMTKKAELLTSCFGLGRISVAPGTFGSLVPVVLYQVLGYLWPEANPWVMGLLLIFGVWVSLQYGPAAIAAGGGTLPESFVADKLAGQALVMFVITLFWPEQICNSMALGFALYRGFDIFLPWPCGRLGKLSGGLGVAADDLMAGAYAAIVAVIVINTMPVCFG